MRTKKTLLYTLQCYLILFTFSTNAQSYNLSITINELKDTTVILGYYFNKQIFVKDTAYTDVMGQCIFSGKEPLKQGIYVVYLPDQTYFDLLIGKEQNIKLSTEKKDFLDHLKISGSKESADFLNYQKFLISKQKEAKAIQENMAKNENNESQLALLNKQLNDLTAEVKNYWLKIDAQNPNTFLALFLKGIQDVDVPEFIAPEGFQNPDSLIQMKRYLYYKDHYFDNLDLSDDRILRTPYFTDKVERFFTKTVIQIPDSLIKESHLVINKAEPNEEVYKYMVQYLFNLFNESKIMGMDAVMADIGETYYLSGKADWVDSTFLGKLKERVEKIKPNIIGKAAADFKMESLNGEFYRLYEVNAPITILVFWEPECGHCKKEIPKLKEEVWDKYADKGIKIVTVYTQADKEPWSKFIQEQELEEWINLSDPYNRSNFRNNYDIYSTPVIYILDKDKKIIAKRIGVEQIPGFLDHYFKYN